MKSRNAWLMGHFERQHKAAYRVSLLAPEPIAWGLLGDALPDAFPQSHPMNAAPVRPPVLGPFLLCEEPPLKARYR